MLASRAVFESIHAHSNEETSEHTYSGMVVNWPSWTLNVFVFAFSSSFFHLLGKIRT